MDKRVYHLSLEISDIALNESSRENFRTMVRLAAEGRVSEFEEKALEDWDDAHRDPMKEFASALNTSLADARRSSTQQKRVPRDGEGA